MEKGEGSHFFLRPLVSDSHLFDAGLPEEHRYAVFPGVDFRKCRIHRFLVRQWIHVVPTVVHGSDTAENCGGASWYASVFIALLGSQWIHVLRQLRKRFDVISTAPCI